MKIGVVHFGCASAGSAQIARTLIDEVSKQGESVYGIEWNRFSKDIDLGELTQKETTSSLGSDSFVLSSFPLAVWKEKAKEIADKLSSLDKIIILGKSEDENHQLTLKQLHVPISIFNDIEGSQLTLGYDTALNSIVKNIESVRDTASSLSYGKVRVFNVQIPGTSGSSMLLKNSCLAVDGVVVPQANREHIEQVKRHIREKEAMHEGYTFLMMDQSVDPVKLGEHFEGFDLDWKVVEIDESQCGGPYPTALDRVIANQLKRSVVDWSLSNQSSGQLLVQDNKILFQEESVSVAKA